MSQGVRKPSFAQKYRTDFAKNFANHGTSYCDGCLLRNFSGPMFICDSCHNFVVCQACISQLNQFHDPSHKFPLKVTNEELKLENIGITCRGCSTSNFTGPRYNCQQCLDPYDLCQRCISRASSLHIPGHTFVAVKTPNNKTVHTSVTCNGCKTTPIVGLRYKCQFCSDYDLCAQCHLKNIDGKIHDAKHQFHLIDKPQDGFASMDALVQKASGAIARIRAKYGPEYNGNAVDAETGWSIADARMQEQNATQLGMMRLQMNLNHQQNMFNILMGPRRW